MTAAWDPAEAARLVAIVHSDAIEDDDVDTGALADQLEAAAAEVDRLKAALPACAHCGERPAVCLGCYGERDGNAFACEACCGHGNEDGWCVHLEDLPAWSKNLAERAARRELDLRAEVERCGASLVELVAQRAQLTSERDELRATIADLDQQRNSAGDALVVVTAERDTYRAMVVDLLASAHPNERDQPSMSRQWARARELLKNGTATLAPPITCSTCDDTHIMARGDGEAPCRRCPLPCSSCAGTASGAFCAMTPCTCDCHAEMP